MEKKRMLFANALVFVFVFALVFTFMLAGDLLAEEPNPGDLWTCCTYFEGGGWNSGCENLNVGWQCNCNPPPDPAKCSHCLLACHR